MPNTSLNLEDIALIERILELRVGDLWKKVYDEQGINVILPDQEKTLLRSTGIELMGADAYEVYST